MRRPDFGNPTIRSLASSSHPDFLVRIPLNIQLFKETSLISSVVDSTQLLSCCSVAMNPMMDFRQNLQKCHEYVRALEEEHRKIQMFSRDLPLCLEIITQALESCKQQLTGGIAPVAAATITDCQNGVSECSEQTSSDAGPVFEEFIPIKRGCFSVQEDTELQSPQISADFNDCDAESVAARKSDWLRSAQLWNQSPDPPTAAATEEHPKSKQPRKVSVVEVKTNGGGALFIPLQNSKEIGAAVDEGRPGPAPATSACSSADHEGIGKKEEEGAGKEGVRKSRRCWSPELHRRFLNALEQLGGPHVATPKQIREQMKVDGLTNDEVKSHLQKYRLHTRRPAPAAEYNKKQAAELGASPSSQSAAGQHPTSWQSAENGVTVRCNPASASSSARATTAF